MGGGGGSRSRVGVWRLRCVFLFAGLLILKLLKNDSFCYGG